MTFDFIKECELLESLCLEKKIDALTIGFRVAEATENYHLAQLFNPYTTDPKVVDGAAEMYAIGAGYRELNHIEAEVIINDNNG